MLRGVCDDPSDPYWTALASTGAYNGSAWDAYSFVCHPSATPTGDTATPEEPGISTSSVTHETAPLASPWAEVNGVCKATSNSMLASNKELQRQLNRVAEKLGLTKVGIDGAIGPQTLGTLNHAGVGSFAGCSYAEAQIDSLTTALKAKADSLGVSGTVASPKPAAPPSIYDPLTGQTKAQGIAASLGDLFKNAPTWQKFAGGVVFGLALLGAHQYASRRGLLKRF